MEGGGSFIALPLGLMFFFSGFLINALQVSARVVRRVWLGRIRSAALGRCGRGLGVRIEGFRAFARFGRAGAVSVVRVAGVEEGVQGSEYGDDGGVVVGAHMAAGLVGRSEGE